MDEKTKRNFSLWEKVENTDPSSIKKVTNGGRSFTAIDAHSQLLTATKLWGSFGDKWGIKNESFNNFKIGQKLVGDIQGDIMLCQYSSILYYPDGEYPISSSIKVTYVTGAGKFKIDDDYAKKVATDALTKGLSKLGFNADVFMGVFDGNKYDGIRNTSIQDDMTEDQANQLKEYRPKLNESQQAWWNKIMQNGLNYEGAEKAISQIEGILNAN